MTRTWGCWMVVLIVLLGCSPAADSNPGSTMIYGRGGDSAGLDPIHVDTGESVKVIVNLYDTLVTYADDTVELVPSLAEKWEVDDAGLAWTFSLREGVKFHDGTLLDAEAVKFSFERLIQDGHPHVYEQVIPYRPNFQDIQRIEVLDARTVVFHLAKPNAVFLNNLAMFPASIVSPTAVKRHGLDFREHPVGTGPFRFGSWIRDQELVLGAFDEYWDGRPRLDRVIFIPVKESAVRIEQLQRGEIHLADDLPPVEIDTLQNHPDIRVQETPGMNLAYLAMHNEKPPLNQNKVRRAIWHAIDKKRLIDLAYGGHAEEAVNPMPKTMWSWHEGIQDRPFDLKLAQQLMQEASAEGGWKTPVELDLFVMDSPRPYLQQPRETAAFIKESLKPLGIEARIIVSETSQHFQRLSRGEHQLALAGWSSDNADPDNFLYQLLDSDNINELGGNNICRYRNEQSHGLLLAGKKELERSRREALYRQVQELIFADAPMVPLVHTTVRVVHRKELQGYLLHPTAMERLRGAFLASPNP